MAPSEQATTTKMPGWPCELILLLCAQWCYTSRSLRRKHSPAESHSVSLCFSDPFCPTCIEALTCTIHSSDRLRLRDAHTRPVNYSRYVVASLFVKLYMALAQSRDDASSASKLVMMIGFQRSKLAAFRGFSSSKNVEAMTSRKKEKYEPQTRRVDECLTSSFLSLKWSGVAENALVYRNRYTSALPALRQIETMDMEAHRCARLQPRANSPTFLSSAPKHTFYLETGSSQTLAKRQLQPHFVLVKPLRLYQLLAHLLVFHQSEQLMRDCHVSSPAPTLQHWCVLHPLPLRRPDLWGTVCFAVIITTHWMTPISL